MKQSKTLLQKIGLGKLIKKKLPELEKYPERYAAIHLQNLYQLSLRELDQFDIIKEGYQKCPTVYAINKLIRDATKLVKWKITDQNGTECQVPLLNQSINGNKPIIEKPNTNTTWNRFIQYAVDQLLLTGNLFITGEKGTGMLKNQLGYVYALPSRQVEIDGTPYAITQYNVTQGMYKSTSVCIPAAYVCHIKFPNPDSVDILQSLYGQSPYKAVFRSIMTVNNSIDMGNIMLKNKGSSKILFPNNEEGQIDETQSKGLKDVINSTTQGIENVGSLALSNTRLGIVDVSIDPQKALMLDQRAKAEAEICNALGVPLQLIGQHIRGIYTEKEAQALLWRNAVIPILTEITDGLNQWLIPTYGNEYKLKFDTNHITALAQDRISLSKSIAQMTGILTTNEARELMGYPPITNGDDLIADNSFQTPPMNNNDNPDTNEIELEYQDQYNTLNR